MKKSLFEIRDLFLKFFKNNNHVIFKGSSLIPNKNDNSILFTNSGMNQFKNILLGNSYPVYKNISTIQKCIRAGGKHNDLDQVGYTNKHHTFFEMLGNFSFDDYFKSLSIYFAFEFITGSNWLNISKDNLLITVNIIDNESYKIWKKLGINDNNIIKLGNKNHFKLKNFWMMGNEGPCGPSTEVFYILDKKNIFYNRKYIDNFLNKKCIEIWNLVFMQFNYNNNFLSKLPYFSVDTGMGLERISSVIQGVNSNYDIDIFIKLIKFISFNLNIEFDKNNVSLKIISDHIRSIIFIINDGVIPSNEGRGYVLRKIIRRAICHYFILGKNSPFLFKIVDIIPKLMKFYKKEIINNIKNIKDIILLEEEKFLFIINKCIKILYNEINKKNFLISGKFVFKLHDTYGLPIFLIKYFINKENKKYNLKEFKYLMKIQKENSRFNSKFYK